MFYCFSQWESTLEFSYIIISNNDVIAMIRKTEILITQATYHILCWLHVRTNLARLPSVNTLLPKQATKTTLCGDWNHVLKSRIRTRGIFICPYSSKILALILQIPHKNWSSFFWPTRPNTNCHIKKLPDKNYPCRCGF